MGGVDSEPKPYYLGRTVKVKHQQIPFHFLHPEKGNTRLKVPWDSSSATAGSFRSEPLGDILIQTHARSKIKKWENEKKTKVDRLNHAKICNSQTDGQLPKRGHLFGTVCLI